LNTIGGRYLAHLGYNNGLTEKSAAAHRQVFPRTANNKNGHDKTRSPGPPLPSRTYVRRRRTYYFLRGSAAGHDHRGAGRAAIGRRTARREWSEYARHVPPPPPPTVLAHECRPRATLDRTSSVVIDRVSK